ncbi:MAG: O-antigen ligase family protein [Pseudomonadota bacterium]
MKKGNLSRRIALFSLGAFALASLMLVKRRSLSLETISVWPIILFTLFTFLAFCSIFWANDPALTFRRVIRFLFPLLGAFAIARRYTLRDLVILAFFVSLIYLIVGIFSEFVLGSFNPFKEGYRFCGTTHPNWQGWNCSMLLFAALSLVKSEKRRWGFFLSIALGALTFLILTKSRTSFISAMLVILAWWVLVSSISKKLSWVTGVGFTFCLLLLLVGYNTFFPVLRHAVLLGREDPSTYALTGRIPMWNASMSYVAERPLLGHGFNSFWTKEHILKISSELQSAIPEAHSGYIELLLGVGMLGLGLFLIVLGLASVRFLQAYLGTHNHSVLFGLAMLLFCWLTMTTEVIAFAPSFPTFIVYALFFVNPRPKASEIYRTTSGSAKAKRAELNRRLCWKGEEE